MEVPTEDGGGRLFGPVIGKVASHRHDLATGLHEGALSSRPRAPLRIYLLIGHNDDALAVSVRNVQAERL